MKGADSRTVTAVPVTVGLVRFAKNTVWALYQACPWVGIIMHGLHDSKQTSGTGHVPGGFWQCTSCFLLYAQ
jgi:hypothetical protein